MATLEDKLLGEKNHYYCSSSEDEDDNAVKLIKEEDLQNQPLRSGKWAGESTNTGPKGVLKDWQRYKQLEAEKRAENEAERLALLKKLSITCMTREEELAADKRAEEEEFADIPEMDEIMMEYISKRMHEMLAVAQPQNRKIFGKVHILTNKEAFMDAVDNEKEDATIFIHIYSPAISSCDNLNACLNTLAEEYPHYKFCVISAEAAGMTVFFEKKGVPALTIYRGGTVIGNFLRITDELGEDFVSTDLESLLVAHGFLPDPSTIPKIVRDAELNNPDDDGGDDDDD